MPILQLNDLSKQVGNLPSIHGLNLTIMPGACVAIHTPVRDEAFLLLDLITGNEKPTTGRIELLGKPLASYKHSTFAPIIGTIDPRAGAYDRLSVREFLQLFARLYGISNSRVNEVLAACGLMDRQATRSEQLGASFQARLRLAHAILHQPKLLLLYEPTIGPDLETIEILRHMILQQLSTYNAGLLLLTSSLEEAEALGNQEVLLLRQGQLLSPPSAKQQLDTEIEQEAEASMAPYNARKIAARVNERTLLFDPTEIVYIGAEDGSTVLHVEGDVMPCPLTLTELEKRLLPFGFFRCHRSYLVNLQRVREVIPWTRNSFSLVLDDTKKTTIPLSKNSARELNRILGLKE